MDLSNLTNPHFAPAADNAMEAPPHRARTRVVTLSPAEEYLRRDGETEAIPDALAALILSRKERVQVTMKGVTIREGKSRRVYWHVDSPLCNRIGSGETLRVYAVWNRMDTSKIHLLTDDGRYLETLPQEGTAAWFDHEEGAKVLADSRRAISRVYHHLQEVHTETSMNAVGRAEQNRLAAETMMRQVMNFEAPEGAVAPETDKRAVKPEEPELVRSIRRGDATVTAAQTRTTNARAKADAHFDREIAPARSAEPVAAKPFDPFDL